MVRRGLGLFDHIGKGAAGDGRRVEIEQRFEFAQKCRKAAGVMKVYNDITGEANGQA